MARLDVRAELTKRGIAFTDKPDGRVRIQAPMGSAYFAESSKEWRWGVRLENGAASRVRTQGGVAGKIASVYGLLSVLGRLGLDEDQPFYSSPTTEAIEEDASILETGDGL